MFKYSENNPFLVETNFPTPKNGRVYVNLLEGIPSNIRSQNWVVEQDTTPEVLVVPGTPCGRPGYGGMPGGAPDRLQKCGLKQEKMWIHGIYE